MTEPQPILISISIVCYYPKEGELESAIGSLICALEVGHIRPASITLIDNSDSNQLELDSFEKFGERLEALDCELRLLQGQGNVGYGSGHNLSLTKADSEFSLIMNSDIEVDPEALRKGIQYLQEHKDVAGVSPAATFESGNKQYLCKRYPSVIDFFLRGFMPGFIRNLFDKRLSEFEMRELSDDVPTKDIPIISGCFILCNTEAIQKVAGFNEEYFLYFEDFDLSMRLSEQYSLAHLPSMKIIHHGGNSARKGLRHIKYFFQSGFRFFRTYGWRWI